MGDTSNWEFAAAVASVVMGLGGLLLFTLSAIVGSWITFGRTSRAATEAAKANVAMQDLARQIAMRETIPPPVVDLTPAMSQIDSLRAQTDVLMKQQARLQESVQAISEAPAANTDMQELRTAVKRLEENLAQMAEPSPTWRNDNHKDHHMAPRTPQPVASYKDPVSMMMAMLLPIHAAVTLDWLVDAAATAAERTLNATYTFVYFEDADGTLERRAPASDLRRRSQQKAVDAFGKSAVRVRLDPKQAPAIAEALDTNTAIIGGAASVFHGLINDDASARAQQAIGVDSVAFVPLEVAGERIGALLMMFVGEPNAEHVQLLADHVSCAVVNLRQAQAARESGMIDVARSVFDARKISADLQRELARAERYKREVSIAVVEATNLTLLRERFGEFLTERLLQQLGETLAQNARDIDVIGAYKESGYTMILTEASAVGAAAAAGRLLATAREMAFSEGSVPGLELHLVAGWATAPADGVTTETIFAAAETRMYDPGMQSQVA